MGAVNILTKIVDKKRDRLASVKSIMPLAELKERIKDIGAPRDFSGAIQRINGPIRLIAEIKKASPSKGMIRADFDPARIASIYESKGVAAISVLTEEDFFQGHLSYIKMIKEVTTRPVLRKDFIFDEYQIYEARANGADAILLIGAMLDRVKAAEFCYVASKLGMTVLFEVHDEDDLATALYVDADVIGINNRNLKTLSINLETTFRLKELLPQGKIIVSESGIRARQDVLALQDKGIDAMLIGTSLMESQDIGKKIDELTQD
jgi:indole-3-glycerol phosphate synthase